MRLLITTTLFATLLLAGCGQKGPLYLPQDDSTNSQYRSNDAADRNNP